MTRARVRALLLGLIAALAVAAVLFAFARPQHEPPVPAADQRPTLLLLTSLPLMFGEDFSLDQGGSPALDG